VRQAEPRLPVVLHVTHSLDFGGVESHLRTLARTSGNRFDHRFCALQRGGAAAESIRALGSDVSILGVDPWRNPLNCIAKVAALVRRIQPEVVHGHGLEGNLIGIAAAMGSGVRVRIAEEIGIPEHSLKARTALRVLYAIATRVIAVSNATRDAIVKLGEAPRSKIVPIYSPVELPAFQTIARKPGEPLRIGFVGRLEPVKNALALVRALTLLPDGFECRLILIGDGSERSTIEKFIRSNRLAGSVVLTGFSEDPAKLLASCHLYVQPSHAEGLGIALIEAMGCGLPVIATKQGGMGEIVEHGVNGWLIASGEPGEIAQAIASAARLQPRQLALIGAAARRSVENRFDPLGYLRKLEQLYEDCLS